MLAFAIPSPSALHSLKGIKVNWYKPLPVEKVVYLLDEYQLVNSRFWGLTWRNREQIWIMLFVIKSWKRVFLGYIVLFPVVYAELRGPIFLVTSTTGEDQDLFDSSITPLSNIVRTSSLASSCFAKSSLRGPWGLGWESQVFVRCRTMLVLLEGKTFAAPTDMSWSVLIEALTIMRFSLWVWGGWIMPRVNPGWTFTGHLWRLIKSVSR